MAKNPFTSVSDVTRKIGKNYYDWSHDYNFTGKIGTIYPVFAKYCPAGQSLSIDTVAGLQFMPMQFPVQSKMKMKLSFWRMPLRAMWKDYTNLVSSQNQPDVQKDYVAPYIDFNHSGAYTDMLAVGGICDYLRIPVTQNIRSFESYSFTSTLIGSNKFYLRKANVDCVSFVKGSQINFGVFDEAPTEIPSGSAILRLANTGSYLPRKSKELLISDVEVKIPFSSNSAAAAFVALYDKTYGTECAFQCFSGTYVQGQSYHLANKPSSDSTIELAADNFTVTLRFKDVYLNPVNAPSAESGEIELFVKFPLDNSAAFVQITSGDYSTTSLDIDFPIVSLICGSTTLSLTKDISPYYDSSSPDKDKQLKLSAYPFRMYEAIYNAYIRYIRNNPFKKNGKAVYNDWLPTMEGGADTTPYKLYRCNWAADAYTTSVQSPQQGVAPIVGLSQATVVGDDGISRVVPAITTEDGKSYGIEFRANDFGLEGVDYTELGTGAKVAPVHSMYDLTQSGISIEDFRMTNAYQRYLELNMMRGYSYKQIVEGRFEVNVKYDDLLMPEFCGGMTRDVFMSGVQQNVEDNGGSGTYVGSLGSEAGVAGCRGELGNKVKIYCDEPSYVMVLVYVVPQSIYSQVCPKDFLYRDLLDAWSPEFDQIGFQPIRYSELCPVESWNTSPDDVNKTFGFQRPWYEYCEVLDASVGLFNTEMRNFLMHRVFSSVPQLGEKFTTVNSESVDHVFSVIEFTDKFFGQIHFSIDVKSPVSRVVIPSLE